MTNRIVKVIIDVVVYTVIDIGLVVGFSLKYPKLYPFLLGVGVTYLACVYVDYICNYVRVCRVGLLKKLQRLEAEDNERRQE